ncbi:helix-turn-helix domain-containing protein [Rubellimicrobium arenae]|uniref:helix-turn-helix domain-containing protein n=1 Tax=Rubellimicrobium arenae TaxID=2817372 RepID=UPI001FEFD5CD|nr:helix-turn-helix transcriptional regulator [Rubellimicrobium arenae]
MPDTADFYPWAHEPLDLDALEAAAAAMQDCTLSGGQHAVGRTMALLIAEVRRLREVAEELEALQAHDAAIADRRESIPAKVVKRILKGEHPIRALRTWRGLTGADLAAKAGMHRAQLHDIEHGRKRGSIDTLKRIAEALGVTVDDII